MTDGADSGLRNEPVRRLPEQEHAVNRGDRVPGGDGHQLEVPQERLPLVPICRVRRVASQDASQIVPEPAAVQGVEAGAGHRFPPVVQPSGCLVHPLQLLPARFAGRAADADEIGLPPLMDPRVGLVRPGGHPHGEHVPSGFHVPRPRQQRKNRRLDLDPASLAHPLLRAVAGHTRDAPAVLDSQQNRSSLQVEEGNELLREIVVADRITLELERGVLSSRDQRPQFGDAHECSVRPGILSSPRRRGG